MAVLKGMIVAKNLNLGSSIKDDEYAEIYLQSFIKSAIKKAGQEAGAKFYTDNGTPSVNVSVEGDYAEIEICISGLSSHKSNADAQKDIIVENLKVLGYKHLKNAYIGYDMNLTRGGYTMQVIIGEKSITADYEVCEPLKA